MDEGYNVSLEQKSVSSPKLLKPTPSFGTVPTIKNYVEI
jgi:hypothetical protein